jgi:hypothetical protein
MKYINKKVALVVAVAGVIAIAAISMASASGVSFTPAGDNLLATSTKVEFAVGGSNVKCTLVQTWGTIPSPAASSIQLEAPLFQTSEGSECGVGSRGKWTLTAINEYEVELTLPNVEELWIHAGSCTVYNPANTSIRLPWRNGTRQALTFGNVEIPVIASSGCSSEVKTRGIIIASGQFVVNDTTHREKLVEVH